MPKPNTDDPVVINCSNPASLQKVNSPHSLGPLDANVVPFCPIPVLFLYSRPASIPASDFLPVDLLRQGLESVLDTYPHLTGRLHLDANGAYPSITSLGTGASLFTATRDEKLSDFRGETGRVTMPDLPDNGIPLMPPFELTLEGVQRQAILLVKHTRFACGSVALGITLHHYVCDASGFFQFVRDLSSIYAALRAGTIPEVPPAVLESYHTNDLSEGDLAEALSHTPRNWCLEEEVPDDPVVDGLNSLETIMPAATVVKGRVIRFSPAELARIKTAAMDNTSKEWITTHEALTAHIWQRTYLARLKLIEEENRSSEAVTAFNRNFLSSINVRRAGRLGLPERYFPNATFPPVLKLEHSFLSTATLPQITAQVHKAYRDPTSAEMEHAVRWIAAQQAAGRLRQTNTTFRYGAGSYIVTQWTSFKMYEGVAFDGADPVLVSQPFTPASLLDGLAMVFSTEEEGAVDVNLTLAEAVWRFLDDDAEFRRYRP